MKDELSALVFELQRARSPVERARALARAWRTLRGLSGAERRLLAREVGFDGAEELIEGLAGKGRGVFAPAAVLEALGKMRQDPSFSLGKVLAGLRDPDKRDDLLVRGIDLAADSVAREQKPPVEGTDELDESELHDRALELDEEEVAVPPSKVVPPPPVAVEPEPMPEPEPEPETEAGPEPVEEPEPEPVSEPEVESVSEPEPAPEPQPVLEAPSLWDELDRAEEPSTEPRIVFEPVAAPSEDRARDLESKHGAAGSVIRRLWALRARISALQSASTREVADELEAFPEPWARRRALVALLEAGVFESAAEALDLIESLERPLDRRWCLATLARRGVLEGDDLDRALEMLDSPAARRRVAGLAAVSAG